MSEWKLKLKYRDPHNKHAYKKCGYKARTNAKRVTYPINSPMREGYNYHKLVVGANKVIPNA